MFKLVNNDGMFGSGWESRKFRDIRRLRGISSYVDKLKRNTPAWVVDKLIQFLDAKIVKLGTEICIIQGEKIIDNFSFVFSMIHSKYWSAGIFQKSWLEMSLYL